MEKFSIKEYFFAIALFLVGMIFGAVVSVSLDIKRHFYKVAAEGREIAIWRLGRYIEDSDKIISLMMMQEEAAAKMHSLRRIKNMRETIEALLSTGRVNRGECIAVTYLVKQILGFNGTLQESSMPSIEPGATIDYILDECAASFPDVAKVKHVLENGAHEGS